MLAATSHMQWGDTGQTSMSRLLCMHYVYTLQLTRASMHPSETTGVHHHMREGSNAEEGDGIGLCALCYRRGQRGRVKDKLLMGVESTLIMLQANWHWPYRLRSQRGSGFTVQNATFPFTFQTFSWHLWVQVYRVLRRRSSLCKTATLRASRNAKVGVLVISKHSCNHSQTMWETDEERKGSSSYCTDWILTFCYTHMIMMWTEVTYTHWKKMTCKFI